MPKTCPPEPIPRAGTTGRPSSQECRQEPGTEDACSQDWRVLVARCARTSHAPRTIRSPRRPVPGSLAGGDEVEDPDAQGGDRLAAVLADPEPAVRCLACGAEFVMEQDLPGRSPDLPDKDERAVLVAQGHSGSDCRRSPATGTVVVPAQDRPPPVRPTRLAAPPVSAGDGRAASVARHPSGHLTAAHRPVEKRQNLRIEEATEPGSDVRRQSRPRREPGELRRPDRSHTW